MKPTFFNKVMFPILDSCNGTKVSKYLNFLRESQWWSLEKLHEYQNQKLRKVIRIAYANCSYYRKILDERGLTPKDFQTVDDLKKLPVLTKQIIKNNYAGIMNKQYAENELRTNFSSGTTGRKTKFYLTKDQDSWRWATRYRMWEWAGYSVGSSYLNIACHPPETIMQKVYSFLFKRSYAPFYECNASSAAGYNSELIENIINMLKKGKSDFIVGYALATYLVARYIKENKTKNIQLKAIITHAESLFPHQREYIEHYFQCPVFDYYGMGGEGVHIAAECNAHEGYHIAMEDVIVEFLRSSEAAPEGEIANVVITQLNNHGFPLIRYKTSDVASWTSRKCSCGRALPLIASIIGRESSIVKTPNRVFLSALYFSELMEKFSGINDFQVIQKNPEKIAIKIVKDHGFDLENSSKIIKEIDSKTKNTVKVSIEYSDSIPLANSGKKHLVLSEVPFEN